MSDDGGRSLFDFLAILRAWKPWNIRIQFLYVMYFAFWKKNIWFLWLKAYVMLQAPAVQ
jgi:hypothetical protein